MLACKGKAHRLASADVRATDADGLSNYTSRMGHNGRIAHPIFPVKGLVDLTRILGADSREGRVNDGVDSRNGLSDSVKPDNDWDQALVQSDRQG